MGLCNQFWQRASSRAASVVPSPASVVSTAIPYPDIVVQAGDTLGKLGQIHGFDWRRAQIARAGQIHDIGTGGGISPTGSRSATRSSPSSRGPDRPDPRSRPPARPIPKTPNARRGPAAIIRSGWKPPRPNLASRKARTDRMPGSRNITIQVGPRAAAIPSPGAPRS